MEGARIKKHPSKLCNLGREVRDDFEERLDAGLQKIQSKLSGLNGKEAHDALVAMVSADKSMYEMVNGGLLYGILTIPAQSADHFRDLSYITNDSWYLTLCNVNYILIELYSKLKEDVRTQLVWFFREAVRSNVPKIDNVLGNLLRNVASGGDFGSNSRLANEIVNILDENREWLKALKAKSSLVPIAVSTFLRLIVDHCQPSFESLKIREVRLCEWILREKFQECLAIGRDLLLMLSKVAKIDEFAKIWHDLHHNPSVLTPEFNGIADLLALPVSIWVIQFRLTIQIQRKIEFIMNKVKFGQHERHLEWFQKQHLKGFDGATLRIDLIRYICVTDFQNSSPDAIPKWVLLSWLLPNNLQPLESQFAKLSLCWDWYCYDTTKDPMSQVNLIEPMYSLIVNSLKVQPTLPISLLDFLCRIATDFHPETQQLRKNGITAAFKSLVETKRVPSLSPLFDSSRLDRPLKALLRQTFPGCFKTHEGAVLEQIDQSTGTIVEKRQMTPPLEIIEDDQGIEGGEFSDDDQVAETIEEIDTTDAVKTRSQFKHKKPKQDPMQSPTSDYCSLPSPSQTSSPVSKSVDFSSSLNQLDEKFRLAMEKLKSCDSSDLEDVGEQTANLINAILQNDDDFDDEQANYMAECLCAVFAEYFRPPNIFHGEQVSEEDVMNCLNTPLFVIYRNLCLTPESDPARRPLLLLMSAMAEQCDKIGYLLLFFMKSNNEELRDDVSAYLAYCKHLDDSDNVAERLVKDLDSCQDDDYRLFGYLLPYVYARFCSEAMNSVELLHLVVSSIDSKQLFDLIGEILMENISVFRKDSFSTLLNVSLGWETVEQYFFWQLVAAENVPIDWVQSIIPKLEYPNHSEAMSNILLMLKRLEKDPSPALFRCILSREICASGDRFTANALKILIEDFDERTADIVSKLIKKLAATAESSHKGKRHGSSKNITLVQVLHHLDAFRQTSLGKRTQSTEQFFSKDVLQSAFHEARRSEPLRMKFNELFAVVEILSGSSSQGRSLRRPRQGKPAVPIVERDSSEDDNSSKPKKKKPKIEESDSD